MPKKAKITLRLVCAHTIEVESRPNPRKPWPDAQMCPIHKKKFRVGEIHTIGTPPGYKSNKLEPMPKKRTRRRSTVIPPESAPATKTAVKKINADIKKSGRKPVTVKRKKK